ncbi:hypothetical protein ACOX9X_06450 [Photobacterium leiognathi subsp. mandapamensis]|uniref:hypothetical protein n=1 Tax=Photobacterium leiognathi TaxID=553611 RepID=UPI003BF5C49F
MNNFSTVEDINKNVKGQSTICENKLNISVDDSSFNRYLLSICLCGGEVLTTYFKNKESEEVWCTVPAKVENLNIINKAIDTGAPYVEFNYFEANKWWNIYVELETTPNLAN